MMMINIKLVEGYHYIEDQTLKIKMRQQFIWFNYNTILKYLLYIH